MLQPDFKSDTATPKGKFFRKGENLFFNLTENNLLIK